MIETVDQIAPIEGLERLEQHEHQLTSRDQGRISGRLFGLQVDFYLGIFFAVSPARLAMTIMPWANFMSSVMY